MAEVGAAIVAAFQYIAGASAAVAAGTATAAQIATVVGVNLAVGAATSAISKQRTGNAPGAPNDWRADPNAPVPIVWGKFSTGGYIVFQKPHGSGDKYLTTVSVLSLGPVSAITQQRFGDTSLVTSNPGVNGVIAGFYENAIWTRWQLGARPEGSALPVIPSGVSVPEWTSAHKLSGLAACISTFDTSNKKKLPRGVEKALWDIEGQLCYDPRLDSTYPGGSGSHRINDRTTWTYSENPALAALTWAIMDEGIDAPADAIVLANFVAGANVCDDNDWTLGGMTTTADPKWGVLAALLEAGGGMPVDDFGRVSAVFNAPAVSVGTLTNDDIVGGCVIRRGAGVTEFFNTAVPKFNSEDHKSQQVAGSAVTVSTFVTADGRSITKEIPLALVYDPVQAGQLARYRIWESRYPLEMTVECKPYMAKYRVGECITATITGSAVTGRKMKVLQSTPNLETMTVTLTLREEVDAKHASALAGSTTAPPVIDFNISGEVQEPIPSEWTLDADAIAGNTFIGVSGVLTNVAGLTGIAMFYRRSVDTTWIAFSTQPPSEFVYAQANSLTATTGYDIGIQYVEGLLTSDIIEVGSITTP